MTPLWIASQNGHLEVVRLLVDAGADKDKAHNDGWTPLHRACFKGHVEVVRLLVEAGADKAVSGCRSCTPARPPSQTRGV